MDSPKHSNYHATGCSPALEEALTLYVDGELPFDQQPRLFAHLSVCESCRQTLDGVMAFRRIAREENLAVPPAADDAFMKRLARHKRATTAAVRTSEHGPVWWRHRQPVTARVAGSVLAGALVMALVAPLVQPLDGQIRQEKALTWVRGEEELVELNLEVPVAEPATVYVFYPGLTVEAPKTDDAAGAETL